MFAIRDIIEALNISEKNLLLNLGIQKKKFKIY